MRRRQIAVLCFLWTSITLNVHVVETATTPKPDCPSGKYGPDCASSCSPQCVDTCNKVDGTCTCKPGWKTPKCTEGCDNGRYGQNCAHMCGMCQGGAPCNKENGHCSACNPGYVPDLCQRACDDSSYGQNCTQICGNCLRGAACNKVSGECSACDASWQLPFCKNNCKDGFYGTSCKSNCSSNCVDVCNKVDGNCKCSDGYNIPLCTSACEVGKYGQNCQKTCGECVPSGVCNHVTGHCSRCEDNRQAPLCQSCIPGHWGLTCGQRCNQCGGNGTCDRVTGVCVNTQCQDGWTSAKCDQKCQDGMYGPNCALTCGHCKDGTTCRHDNGICEKECEDGYEGVLCQTEAQNLVPPVVGAIFGATAIIVMTMAALAFYFKRKRGRKQPADKYSLPLDDTTSVRDAQASPTTNYQNVCLTPGSGPNDHLVIPPDYDRVDLNKRENHLYDKHVASAAVQGGEPGTGASAQDLIYQNTELHPKEQKKPMKPKKPEKGVGKEPEAVYGNVEVP